MNARGPVTADVGMPVRTSPGGVRVERVVTSGAFELDGGSWEVENNVWLVGDDSEVHRRRRRARRRRDPDGRR